MYFTSCKRYKLNSNTNICRLQKPNERGYHDMEVQKEQSLKELKYLNNCRHDNILPLYGYSIGGEKPCLIYQYMPYGSLEDRLQCRVGFNDFQSNNVIRNGINLFAFISKILSHYLGYKEPK